MRAWGFSAGQAKMQPFPPRMRLSRGQGGEAVGRWSALPVHRSGLAKKIISIHISPLVYFCLLESKEGTFISNDCKNMDTDLWCVNRGRAQCRWKIKYFCLSWDWQTSMNRHSTFFLLTFTKSEEFLPKTCSPHSSVWVGGGNAEQSQILWRMNECLGKRQGGKYRANVKRETGKKSFALFVAKRSFMKGFAVGACIQVRIKTYSFWWWWTALVRREPFPYMQYRRLGWSIFC